MASSTGQVKRLLQVSDSKYDIDIEIGQSKITTSASGNPTIVKPEPVCAIDELLAVYKLEVSDTSIDLQKDLPHQQIDLMSEEREIKNELFTCFECQRHFLTKDNILNHATSGFCGGVCCDACLKEFLTNEELVDHLQVSCSAVSGDGSGIVTQNVESPNAVIDKFDKTSLQLAVLESTQELKTCDHCNETFSTKPMLTRHVRIHQPLIHKCDVCLKAFREISTLLAHRRKVHEGRDPYECNICKQTFSSKRQRMSHTRTHKIQQSYCCKICEKSFPFPSKLKTHEYLSHSDDRPFKCECCGKQFRSDHKRKIHQNTCGQIYGCKICSRTFASLLSRARHARIHNAKNNFDCKLCVANNSNDCGLDHEREEFKCDDCFKVFSKKKSLLAHVSVHFHRLPYQCEICGRSFVHKSRKIEHMTNHSLERPYKCEFCDGRFKSKPQLVSHRQRHTDEKPYSCEFCDKKFKCPSDVKNHAKVHSTEVPYKCELCEKRFKRKRSANLHRRTHTGERPYGCKLCDKTFSSPQVRWQHAILHLAELPFNCDFCEKRFSSKFNAEAHRRAHLGEKPHVCNVCGKTSSSARNIQAHSKRHLEGMPFIVKCDVCTQLFQNKNQLSAHTGSEHTRKKKCDICGLIFTDLKYHSKIVHGKRLKDSDLKIDIEKLGFKCKVGEVSCRTETRLNAHMMRTHVGNGDCHKCDDCWKEFSTKARLVSHFRIHCVALAPALLSAAPSV